MTEKRDFKKEEKELYLPGKEPVLVNVPPILYLMVDGSGAPESESYQQAMQILYGLAFTIKMSKMSGSTPQGYFDFVVPPLEGLWDCGAVGFDPDRDQWSWTSMLRQPEFVTQPVFQWAVEQLAAKKPALNVSRARLQRYDEKLCVQLMHIGPYSAEQASIDKITAYIAQNGLVDRCGTERRHHEIYLGDPRKTAPEKLRTVLRHPVDRL